ncbi:hypothetical protein PVAND_007832 [Polypedilum vanderplanki]|uniref:carboxylesterase n=1 Tax=Polypedilum vanderplanki TaxID=319348 RepID=A0A9J6C911_POLVA|nr:hypothetical protein PVAND_007832 [Polypedilum vanderplanki]
MIKTNVKVQQGVVKGCIEKLPNGKNYFRFSGIPYAQSPIGDLRFKSPQKLLKFDKPEIDCTKEGSECFHRSAYITDFVGSEDCLYLNVYVPESEDSSEPKAVMVWLHGGGFSFGSGSIEWYSPEYLLMEDVIVITVNYRLHALGFLTLPSMGINGNAGLKDQQMALEWIYKNISNFNGDVKRICLFGESAGGASVHFQVLSSKSRKFISTAICQSGVAICDWAVLRDAEKQTKLLAKHLGCISENDKDIYDTFMNTSAKDLFNCITKTSFKDKLGRHLTFVFKPCIERESDDAFMSKSPIELMKTEDIKIPIIFGTNDADGMIQTAAMRKRFSHFNKNLIKLIPESINIKLNDPNILELGKQIKSFYFGERDISIDEIYNFIDYMTDIYFLIGQTVTNELHARYQHNSKQYLYEFRFDGELNLFKKVLMMEEYKGACHADEVFYLFGQRNFDLDFKENSPTAVIRSILCKLWTNFAKYNNPTPKNKNPLSFEWQPANNVDKNVTKIDFDYLIIDENFKMEKNVNKRRMDFWREVYKTWNSDFVKPKL